MFSELFDPPVYIITESINTNNIIDGNTFSNNGSGALKLIGTAPAIPSGTASNNVYQTNNTFFNGTSSGFTLSNNNSNSQSSTNLALYKSYIASSNWDNNQRASKAFDGSVATNWQSANTGYANQWLRINFGANTTFDKVVLSEYGNRTSGFRIEYSNDGITWQTAYTGSTIGNSNTITFTAVTGKMARIYFTNGANTPIIFEFEIYPVAQAGGSNLASNKTYYSSSDWDATQTADKGFDGNYSTDWQSANGSAFANQWLQVNFGAPTAFDSIKLSEYGGRTTGYSVEYSSNGTSWQTAYTGTTIDTSKTITFAAVTGNYARIFFTSGANTPIIFEFEVYKKQVTTNPNLSLNKTYGSSSNWDATQTADKACDANPGTNWQAVNGSAFSGQWLQVNFGATTTFNRVILSEYGNRTTGYHIEYSNDGTSWQIAYTGTTIGASTTVNFTAVTGNYVRVFFTSGSNTPIIYEFEIYNSAANRVAQIKQPVTIIDEKPLSTIYPNPSHGFVNVFYKLPKKSRASVNIYTLEGKVIQQLNFTYMDAECGKIDLNIQSVNSGTYIIKINSKDHLVAHKLIIVK